jgi:hypothetical protein
MYRGVVFMSMGQSIGHHILAPWLELDGELVPEELADPGVLRNCG